MTIPVSQLIAGQMPVCARQQDRVRDALVRMVENDFSQLPIVDEAGNLTGIISEKSITRAYFHSEARFSLFDLTVDHCQEQVITLEAEDDIFEALNLLSRAPAIVIVSDRKPLGVLTYFDTTGYFRSISEDLMYVEEIETALKRYIESVLDTDSKFAVAMGNAFPPITYGDSLVGRGLDDLTLNDLKQLISNQTNWLGFKRYFDSRRLFHAHMENVRAVRNQLAHFRGDLDAIQHDALLNARTWLLSRPDPYAPTIPSQLFDATFADDAARIQAQTQGQGKYAPIRAWLLEQPASRTQVQLTFDDLAQLIGDMLPQSARVHRSWWANDMVSHVQSQAWLRAGWQILDVDIAAEAAVFQRSRRAQYHTFFADVLEQVHKRQSNFAPNATPGLQNWLSLETTLTGFAYGLHFEDHDKFSIRLTIATGSRDANTEYFDQLYTDSDSINAELGTELIWSRLTKKGTSEVSLERAGSIDDSDETIEELKQWTVDNLLTLVDTYQPYIRELHLE